MPIECGRGALRGGPTGIGDAEPAVLHSDTDAHPDGHVVTCASVKENTSPPLRCDVASVTGVQLVQLQKLLLG